TGSPRFPPRTRSRARSRRWRRAASASTRAAVVAKLPEGSSVMTFPSVTLEAAGLMEAIDESGRYASARTGGWALDRATQMREIKTLMLIPDFAVGSVQAITRD